MLVTLDSSCFCVGLCRLSLLFLLFPTNRTLYDRLILQHFVVYNIPVMFKFCNDILVVNRTQCCARARTFSLQYLHLYSAAVLMHTFAPLMEHN